VGPVAQLVAALDELASEEISGHSVRDDVLALEQARARLDAEVARRLREFDQSCEWSVDGSKSAAAFLQRHTRCASGEAHARVRVAREVAGLDDTVAAWSEGIVTTRHVEAIARARHSARANTEFDEFAPALAAVARAGSPDDVARTARQWRDALDADLGRDGAAIEQQQHERRRFDFSRSIDGMGFGLISLDPTGAEFVETALRRAYEALHTTADDRTPAQQRADALVEICRRYTEGLSGRTNLPSLLMIVDEATLEGNTVGECRLASGARISPETARRLRCDANVQRVSLDADAVPLALGRATRTFTPDQFRYFVVRDAHCRGPGCQVAAAHCEAHHLDEWHRDDGPTDVDNGALFCRGHCHRMLHEGGWSVRGDPNGTLDFYDRNGTHLGSSTPAARPEAIVLARARKRQRVDRHIRNRVRQLRAQCPERVVGHQNWSEATSPMHGAT
jgi:hypothetical protein